MKFSEIANRLTGISTPLGGVSWQSSDLEVSAARRVIAFLEDRRVLYAAELQFPDVPLLEAHLGVYVRLAHLALDAHIQKQATGQPPVAADETTYLAGAEVYKQHCAACHGTLGEAPTDYATTMLPGPPQLFRGKGVTDDPVSESYWKTANGIRLSGMTGFKTKLSDTQIWQVSQLLAHANEISDPVKKALVLEGTPSASAPGVPAAPAPNSKK